METKFIAYYRVSTKRQNLGLDAQQATVTNYVRSKGGVIVSSYQEKASVQAQLFLLQSWIVWVVI